MADDVMAEDRFWFLIDQTKPGDNEPPRQLIALAEVLRPLSAAEIEAFERAFRTAQKQAYSWDLWGAAYVLNGGASDDGFEYFQRWLVSRGRKVFEAAVANPNSLADVVAPGTLCKFEEFAYVPGKVWTEKTGLDPWKDPNVSYPYTGAPPPCEPSGEPFEEDQAHLAKRYPKLWARFGPPA